MELKDTSIEGKDAVEGEETCGCVEKGSETGEQQDGEQQDNFSPRQEDKSDCATEMASEEMASEADCKDGVSQTISMAADPEKLTQDMGNTDNVKESIMKDQMELNGYPQGNPVGPQVDGQSAYQAAPAGPQPGYVDPAAYAAWQQAIWIQQQQAAAQNAAQQAAQHSVLMGQRMFQGMPYQRMPNFQPHGGFAPQPQPAYHDHHVKHDEHKYGQLLQVAQKFATGTLEPQDVATGLSLIQEAGDQFWRGLLVGGVAALILGSESVRNGLFSMFSKDDKNN